MPVAFERACGPRGVGALNVTASGVARALAKLSRAMLLASVTAAMACTESSAAPQCDDGACPDAGATDATLNRDARPRDGAGPFCRPEPGDPAGPCFSGVCGTGGTCQAEITDFSEDALNTDGTAGSPLTGILFSGSFCAAGCNTSAMCGECGVCIDYGLLGRVPVGTSPVCRAFCVPTEEDPRGGCRLDQQCDLVTLSCMDGCQSDEQCRYTLGDPDGNMQVDVVYEGAGSRARCDLDSGRCYLEGNDAARPGDPCMRDADCEDNGICIRSTNPASPLAEGFCSKLDCLPGDLGCTNDSICSLGTLFFTLGIGAPMCLPSCRLAAEASPAEVVGPAGGNPDCNPGETCWWDGLSLEDPAGGCFPGNYNSVSQYNVGEPCASDGDCYSPYGRGVCLRLSSRAAAVCAVLGCEPVPEPTTFEPGVTIPEQYRNQVCDFEGGDRCFIIRSQGSQTLTACIEGCTSPADCASGMGCTTVGSSRVCFPRCAADSECQAGFVCRDTGGGSCTPDLETCSCQDPSAPPPGDGGVADAGMLGSDAGQSEDAGVDTPDNDGGPDDDAGPTGDAGVDAD